VGRYYHLQLLFTETLSGYTGNVWISRERTHQQKSGGKMSVPSVAQMLKTVDISMPQYVAIMAQDGGMELLATEFSKAGYPPVLPSAPTRSYLTPRAQVQPRRCIDVEAGFPSASTDRCDYNHHWCERDAKHSDLRQRDGIHSASTHGPVHELARRSLMNGLTPSHTYTYTVFELAVVFARHPRVPVIPGAQLFGSLNRKNLGAVVHNPRGGAVKGPHSLF
jgi:hypothetical protein